MVSGLALIDKPGSVTSHDEVARLRKELGTRQMGHAGTLDPMATGLLILGVGSATRLMQFFLGLDKSYRATVVLGQSTTTDDAEGETVAITDASAITAEQVLAALAGMTGEQLQLPSKVSAKKVKGKRAYDLVREGKEFELEPKQVTISRIEVMGELQTGKLCQFEIEVDCSSGTYIRAIARDLGEILGVGGHLSALRRLSIGPFSVDE
ncbi:MAG: tRNA pseudouridine(55) synthase TruB, partial [Aquiluna sp.]